MPNKKKSKKCIILKLAEHNFVKNSDDLKKFENITIEEWKEIINFLKGKDD